MCRVEYKCIYQKDIYKNLPNKNGMTIFKAGRGY